LNQAQLLSDILFYQDGLESHQWLIYYISKPLVGTIEPLKLVIANNQDKHMMNTQHSQRQGNTSSIEEASSSSSHPKKEIKSFQDLLTNFPMIARQMQPGLERVFNEFSMDISKPQSPLTARSPVPVKRRSSSASGTSSSGASVLGGPSHSHSRRTSVSRLTIFANDEEDLLRRTLETAVISAIDLFQLVDKQQLSLLGATTELTGSMVERYIERYVVEQVHHSVLFPRVCSMHHLDDLELESRMRRMLYIDVAQVGIEIEGGRYGKEQLLTRLNRGVNEFKKLSEAVTPQDMLDILVETQKIITSSGSSRSSAHDPTAEKASSMTTNADTLVSLLLIIVIRSHVRQLQARLAYMRGFIFIDDVEGGELGYALSTFEAVLSYLVIDSGGLHVASRRNKMLWQAIKKGKVTEMRSILEPNDDSFSDETGSSIGSSCDELDDHDMESFVINSQENDIQHSSSQSQGSDFNNTQPSSDLSHVFPFQRHEESPFRPKPKLVKRVSIDLRSLSSDVSFHSRTSTITSMTGTLEGDTSIDKLCQTQDLSGNSVLMMAVESAQPESLDYLLSLGNFFTMQAVLDDVSSEGSTLLSAAVQTSNQALVSIIVEYIWSLKDTWRLKSYVSKPDSHGRTMAHYLFQAPYLIDRFGTLLPWQHKDKNGQTPLLALCRSYDHAAYLDMVNAALKFATEEQGDGQALHMDNHIDNKGNSLLHVVSEPYLALRILQHCDADANATNDKQFTPLMVASKFGRFDLVRARFLDRRVDIQAKEYRGMSAVELAKDDDVRNRMDDMLLVSNVPAPDGRVTAVVRSFFVEDATIRLIIKTAARSGDGMIAVTTCRRSLADFEHLAKWLAIEHPASWLPSIFTFRSPFQIPSKPSRSVLHDIQVRLDKFLQIMLAHSTFSTHELLWEFILVPDLQPDMMAERSLLKSEIRQEKIKEDYEPLEEYRDVESFVTHARESVRAVNHSTKSSLRRINGIRNAASGMHSPVLVCRMCR
jgi:ankyrin repeat protein